MKYFFISTIFILITYCAGAQISAEKLKELELKVKRGESISIPLDSTLAFKNNFKVKTTFSGRFPLPGIYNLPQDNMPCIVPDTKEIAGIPNVVSKIENPFISKIPNPYLAPKSK